MKVTILLSRKQRLTVTKQELDALFHEVKYGSGKMIPSRAQTLDFIAHINRLIINKLENEK